MINYKHTQIGSLVLIALGLGIALTVTILILAPTPFDRAFGGVVAGVLLLCLFLFRSLTVVVDSTKLELSFGPGAFRKRFQVGDVVRARIVRNPWYYGWGIRRTPHGWMYNVSGFDAVEVEFRDQRKFRIGTNEPDQLLKAIDEAVRQTPKGT